MAFERISDLSIAQATEILSNYSCTLVKALDIQSERRQLQQALLRLVDYADFLGLGICADHIQQAQASFYQYLEAFEVAAALDIESQELEATSLYIRYDTRTQATSLESYSGSYRGVLITYRAQDGTIIGSYGHFPLDLFAPVLQP